MSAVGQEDMGVHSARSAMCNKHMVYRCDDGAIGQERMGYRSGMSEWRRVKLDADCDQ